MSEWSQARIEVELNSERGQEPSLATATRELVPARSAPARQGQERER